LRPVFRIIKPIFNARSGFALIEILVAVSVLAISLVVIFQLFSGGLKSRKLSEQYARGVFHAREKMAEILLSPDLSVGEIQGEFEDAYKWQAVITRVVDGDGEEKNLPINLLNIRMRINWREGEKKKSFVIDTLKAVEKEKGS
jgi:general secretion pathway protein I